MLQLAALLADVAEEGKHIVLSMLVVGFIFIGVIAMGQFFRWLSTGADPLQMRTRPAPGTVTFLFTDVEGSTKLLHELGAEAYDEALIEHRRVLREALRRHGGVEVDTQGDAFFFAFPTAPGAVVAAREAY